MALESTCTNNVRRRQGGDEAKCAGKHLPLELRFPRWEEQSGGGRRAAAGQLTGAWTRVEAGGFGKTRKR